jgi:hypothetical protein
MAVVPIDDFSPIARGDTGSPFIVQFRHKFTGGLIDLTGCTISMKMQNEEDPEDIKECSDNDWHVDDAENGIAHYDFQDTDVNTVGTYNMHITIIKNAKPLHADKKQLVIEAVP